ncbi:hypothetical protein E3N88_18713 [Mikania micrantha]|uniref:Uncharacterized protein n=1 Tax=Mikania micrantha TaxID=192012 RepID=A0A5N6NP58_9ASTR|nr:hypothetical protein E3N88_18713 [Mikania micrantha]
MVVNGGVTIILFVVTNPVCVPKKRNLSIFRGLKGAWKHIRTLEWKWKRDGTPVPSEMAYSPQFKVQKPYLPVYVSFGLYTPNAYVVTIVTRDCNK